MIGAVAGALVGAVCTLAFVWLLGGRDWAIRRESAVRGDTAAAVKRNAIPGLAESSLGTQPTRACPSSAVTWVVSDIEGSTRLWEACPRSTKLAHNLHDTLVRSLLADYHGSAHNYPSAFCWHLCRSS